MKIGQEAVDKITGFKGIIIGKCEYISGCTQYLVQPKVKKGGEYVSGRWIDEDRPEATKAKPVNLTVQTNGPDLPAPLK